MSVREGVFLYDHDQVTEWILSNENVGHTESWNTGKCEYHWPYLPENKMKLLQGWKLSNPLPSDFVKKLPTSL